MSITPPTPAEVAEARAYFRRYEFEIDELAQGWRNQRLAAVLVRAAVAAPAEQPREDIAERALRGEELDGDDPDLPDHEAIGKVRREVVRARERNEFGAYVKTPVLSHVADLAERAARSVSPSAVSAVSAGGAGRDLTAADVRQAWRDVFSYSEHREVFQWIAEHLNRIARPADPGTQATEQTTEYRVAMDFGPRWMPVTAVEAAAVLRGGRRVEQRSVSPWSPVAVHDENGAQA